MNWINIKDSYPTQKTKVLFIDDGEIYLGWYHGVSVDGKMEIWTPDNDSGSCFINVKWWMPLSLSPKD
jgi:hypothetical protein